MKQQLQRLVNGAHASAHHFGKLPHKWLKEQRTHISVINPATCTFQMPLVVFLRSYSFSVFLLSHFLVRGVKMENAAASYLWVYLKKGEKKRCFLGSPPSWKSFFWYTAEEFQIQFLKSPCALIENFFRLGSVISLELWERLSAAFGNVICSLTSIIIPSVFKSFFWFHMK